MAASNQTVPTTGVCAAEQPDPTPGRAQIAMIWAQTVAGIIGFENAIPWHIPEDFAHFKAATLGSPVIMGRKTWQSLPDKSRPLPGRCNIVISRDPDFAAPGGQVVTTLDLAVDAATRAGHEQAQTRTDGSPITIWVMGGSAIYDQFLDRADRLEVTIINNDIAGDAVAPQISNVWIQTRRDPAAGWHTSRTGLEYAFLTYHHK